MINVYLRVLFYFTIIFQSSLIVWMNSITGTRTIFDRVSQILYPSIFLFALLNLCLLPEWMYTVNERFLARSSSPTTETKCNLPCSLHYIDDHIRQASFKETVSSIISITFTQPHAIQNRPRLSYKNWIILIEVLLNYLGDSEEVFYNRTSVENPIRNDFFN